MEEAAEAGFVEGGVEAGEDAALAVEQEGEREDLDAGAVAAFSVAIGEQDGVIDLVLGDEGADGAPAGFIDGDAEEVDAAGFEFLVNLDEIGDFAAAGGTPGGPEVEQNEGAAEVIEGDPGAIVSLEAESGDG